MNLPTARRIAAAHHTLNTVGHLAVQSTLFAEPVLITHTVAARFPDTIPVHLAHLPRWTLDEILRVDAWLADGTLTRGELDAIATVKRVLPCVVAA